MIIVPTILPPEIMTAAEVRYNLATGIVDYDIDEGDREIVRSVIDGTAAVIDHGEFFKGTIDYYGATVTQYGEIKALQGAKVRLWPFGISAISGTNPARYYPYVDVIIIAVRPYHRNNQHWKDAIIIEFVSEKPYTLARAAGDGLPLQT